MEQPAAHAHHTPIPQAPPAATPHAPAPQAPSDAAPHAPAQQRPLENEALNEALEEVYRTPVPDGGLDDGVLSLGIMGMLEELTKGYVSFKPNPSGTVTTSHAAGRTTIQQAEVTVEKNGEQSKENVWFIFCKMITPESLKLTAVGSPLHGCSINGVVYVPCYKTAPNAPHTDNTKLHTDTLCTALLRVDKALPVTVTSLLSEAAWRSTAPGTIHLNHVVVDCTSTQLVKQQPQAAQGVIPAQASSPWSTGGSSPASGPVLGNVPSSVVDASRPTHTVVDASRPTHTVVDASRPTHTVVDASRPTHTVKQFVVRVVLCDTSGGPSGENIHVEWSFHGCHDPTLSPESVRQQVLAKVAEKLNKSQMSNERIFLGGVNNRAIVLAGDELANLKRLIEIRVLYWLIYTGDVTQETPAVPFDMKLGCAGHKIKVELQHPAVTNRQGVLKNEDLSKETLKQVGEDYLLGTGRERTHASAEAPGPSTNSAPRKARAPTAAKRKRKDVDGSDDEPDSDNDDPDAGPKHKHKAADPAAPPSPAPLTRSQVTQLPIPPEQLKVLLRNESIPGSEYDVTRIIRALAQAGNLASGIVLFTAKMTKLRAEVIVLTLRYIAAIAFVIAGSTDLTCLGMDQGDLDSVKEWMETFSTRLPKLLNGGELGATQMSTGATATDAGMPRVPPPEFNIAWILVVVLFATKVVIVPKDFVETTLVKHLHNVMQTSDPVSETSVLISNLKKLDQKIDDQAINRMKVPKPVTPN